VIGSRRSAILIPAALLVAGLALAHGTVRVGAQVPAPEASQPAEAPRTLEPGEVPPPDLSQPAGADPWGFDEEEKVETWGDILRPQALDLVLMTAFFTFALVSFFKKSKPLKYAALVMSVAYLGITKSTLISITDIFRLVALDFPQFKYSIAWYLFAIFTVVTTVLWGRLYCGRICAFGAFTQLLDAVVPKRIRREPPVWLERRAGNVKYVLLAAVVGYYILTRNFLVYRYVEPFWMFTGSGTLLLWSMLGTLLIATLVVRNLYCRFLCPVGAMLGIIGQVTTVFSIKRWSECKTCKICEKACEWGAIDGPRIIKSECVRCDDCERIYDDKKKCVHWLMIVKKEKLAAKAAATV
jgi:polyferredoxin